MLKSINLICLGIAAVAMFLITSCINDSGVNGGNVATQFTAAFNTNGGIPEIQISNPIQIPHYANLFNFLQEAI
ncbi:MAG: hypothetical protein FWE57_05430 [Chitinispirillia bacterium]|nr:hypothetical protein [Chitinispirillia bacterium]